MATNDDAPQFFVSGLLGVMPEGPNVILSFATAVPNEDHQDRKYCVNVRLVMSVAAVDQMVEFLQKSKGKGAYTHQMPETKQ